MNIHPMRALLDLIGVGREKESLIRQSQSGYILIKTETCE